MSDIINNNCTGCSVVSGKLIPLGGVIFETANFVLAQDAEVPLKGFLIIQSKKHFNSLLDLGEIEQIELMQLINKTRKALSDLNICKEVTFVQEERSMHFHIWIYPFYEWMNEKFGKGIKYLRDINDYLIKNSTEEDKIEVLETVENLKKYFKMLDKEE